jgi:hypothetical protein
VLASRSGPVNSLARLVAQTLKTRQRCNQVEDCPPGFRASLPTKDARASRFIRGADHREHRRQRGSSDESKLMEESSFLASSVSPASGRHVDHGLFGLLAPMTSLPAEPTGGPTWSHQITWTLICGQTAPAPINAKHGASTQNLGPLEVARGALDGGSLSPKRNQPERSRSGWCKLFRQVVRRERSNALAITQWASWTGGDG